MAATYELITKTTVGSSVSSVTLSGIPATYIDLVLKCTVKTSDANVRDLLIKPNNDGSTTYYGVRTLANGSNDTASITSADSVLRIENSASGTAQGATNYGQAEVYFYEYAASVQKLITAFGSSEAASTTAYLSYNALAWRDTNSITSLNISCSVGNVLAGSTFFLYGITEA